MRSKKIRRGRKSIDYMMFACAIVLAAFGIITMAGVRVSATDITDIGYDISMSDPAVKQLVIFVCGLPLLYIVSKLDYQKWYRIRPFSLTFAVIIGMTIAFFPEMWNMTDQGVYISAGDTLYLNYGILVEFVACIILPKMIYEARYFFFYLEGYGMFMTLLMFSGNIRAILIVSIVSVALLMIKEPKKAVLTGVGTVIFCFGAYEILGKLLKASAWKEMIQAQLLNQTPGMENIYRIATGGVFGAGVGEVYISGNTAQAECGYITSLISGQSGWFGLIIFLLIYLLFFWRAGTTVMAARTTQEFYLAAAITIKYAAALLLNLLCAGNILPLSSIGIPFVSYGGTQMMFDMVLLGVLLGISRKTRESRGLIIPRKGGRVR